MGGKSKSESKNKAYGYLRDTYAPVAEGGVDAFGTLGGLLGIGGDPEAASAGYQNFLNSAGFQNVMDTAMQGVTNSAAGRGLLRSGATGKALQDRAANLGQQYFQNYLGSVGNLANLGMNAGQLIGQAGQTQKSKSKGGLGSALGGIGSLASGAASLPIWSDRRLKTDIEKVGEFEDGLGLYDFNYRGDMGLELPARRVRGVMADEVAELRPWAVGPVIAGYATVLYHELEAR